MKKFLTGAATALALIVAQPLAAQHTLNVRDADIRAFIQDAARVTGRTFIIDQRVQGKVSVVTDRPLSRSEYFEVFLSTLRANGLVAVPTAGGAFRVQPADTAASQPGRVGTRGGAQNAFVTEVFRLKSIDATSAVETLRPLVSKEGSVTANRSGNSIVVADFADNVRRIRQLVNQIDRDSASTTVVPLKNAGAREIAASLQQLVGAGVAGAEGAPGRGPAATIVPIDSSNSIALRGDPSTVARLVEIARDLDVRAASGTEIRVVWLEHADAALLLPVLQQLIGQQPTMPTPAAASGGGGNGNGNGNAMAIPVSMPVSTGVNPLGTPGRGAAIVTRYEGANAIIISAPADVQRQLGEVVRQLDTRREQVLVEAIIVEMSDIAAKQLGVQFLFGGKPGSNLPFGITNYSNVAPRIGVLGAAVAERELKKNDDDTDDDDSGLSDLEQAALQEVLSASGGIAGIATKIGEDGIFGAIINAVKSDNKSNILSTPWLYTLDNKEAKILVGQEIPVSTGEALSDNFDNAFRTIQRQNVGIQLEVKPQINSGGAIKLFLRQEVSSIAGPVSDDFNELILNKREIETTITVDDGEIVALGGLLDDNERRTIEKIPFLGDLPGIGALFRAKARQRSKTNLMIFIRPTIVRSASEARAITEQRYGYARREQLLARPDREPTLDELVRDYLNMSPPIPVEQRQPASVPALPAPAAAEPEPAPGEIRQRSSTQTIRPVEVPVSEAPQ
ncbi:type II secretion system secretin GspD [Sphingomonas cavernae]|uniref:Type II secretion system protein GspD n=1 Tax=Sphingomonas cavernae TaxID=2320861 RepID=A0A418WNX9_9SPHN|nr:type II secretion system secretin GspD [Sphingomonas cavernae]RJF92941.1 type II secretion system protein GspD [Sphingomonas cavernae]